MIGTFVYTADRGATTDMSTDSADSWKKKYFASLEGIESKERALNEVEGVLSLALNRLTLAAEGVDKGLDRQLAELRKSARATFDKQRLERLIEAISETVKHLDSRNTKSGNRENSIVTTLVSVLDAVTFSKRDEKKVNEVRKQLKAVSGGGQPEQVLSAFIHLINESLAASAQSNTSKDAQSTLEQSAPATTTARAETAVYPSVGSAVSRNELSRDYPAKPVPSMPFQATHEILIQLLDNIVIPAELSERAESIKEKLSAGKGPEQWSPVVRDIAELVVSMRARLEAEKSELESFLVQLTRRLQELDQHLQGAETINSDRQTRSRALDADVHAQMDGIETSVRGASNLVDLKASIQERIDRIKIHFEQHRQVEEEHNAALQAQLKKVTSRLNSLEGETGRLRTHLQEQQLQATMDGLTNLPNRLAYDARLEREVARWKRYKNPLSLLVLDVDRFKQINDTYGHKAGDKALKLIAHMLKQAVRETDYIARYGGEEFVAILADTPNNAAKKVAEKMRSAVEAADFHHNKLKVDITISVGISSFKESDTAEKVFLRADKALYHAKSLGRNRCVEEGEIP